MGKTGSTLKRLNVVGYDVPYGANAFEIMGGFKRAALLAGWGSEDVSAVILEATSGDYENLIEVISKYCE